MGQTHGFAASSLIARQAASNLQRVKLFRKLYRLFRYPLINFIAICIGEIEKMQAHTRFMSSFALIVPLPDNLTPATNCVPGLRRQGQFNHELFTQFPRVYRSNKQPAAAGVFGVTEKVFPAIAAWNFLYNQRSPCGTTLILLFRSILRIVRHIYRHLFIPFAGLLGACRA